MDRLRAGAINLDYFQSDLCQAFLSLFWVRFPGLFNSDVILQYYKYSITVYIKRLISEESCKEHLKTVPLSACIRPLNCPVQIA